MEMCTLDSGKRTKSTGLERLTMSAKASSRDSLKMEEDMEKASLSMSMGTLTLDGGSLETRKGQELISLLPAVKR